jgi:diguanylate cyclase (GGDEF)-like protein/PAS domain S-box-containing protein
MNKFISAQKLVGIALLLLGINVMSGWLLHNATMVQIHAGFVGMVFNTALCFALIGIAILVVDSQHYWRSRIIAAIGWAMIVLATLVLAENFSAVNFTIDLPSLHQWLNDSNPHPGRMAPNTSLGFMLCGAVLLLMHRVENKLTGTIVQIATYAVLAIGLTGIAGYSFHLELFYSWFNATRMALHTAMGMVLTGAGLWLSWRHTAWYRTGRVFKEDEKIILVSVSILTVVALTAGIAAFSAHQRVMEKIMGENLSAALKNRVALFQAATQQRDISAKKNALRPDLIKIIYRLNQNPQDAGARRRLREVAENILASGFTGIAIFDGHNTEILRLGAFVPDTGIAADLGLAQPASLLWNGSYYLNSRAKILDTINNYKLIGALTIEQPLPVITQQYMETNEFGATGEVVLCLGKEKQLLCFPQRFNPTVFSISRYSIAGSPLPMSYAVEGQSGVIKTLDYRAQQVIAAYGPTGAPGLGIVVKQDVAELYQPIRSELQWATPILLLFVVSGVWLLRSQVKPLATKLLLSENEATEKELRIRSVVDSIGEGIITLNEHGIIESFNAAASHIFGYAPAEIIGQNIQLLIPPEMRALHEADMHRYLTEGTMRVIGKPGVHLPGLRKDGTVFQLELSINVILTGDLRSFVGILRDVTERKLAEAALFAEKERLRVTLSSIGDAVITTDTAGKITYLNPVAETMTGWLNQEAEGLLLAQVFHIQNEKTGELAPNPVELVLLHKRTAGLVEDTLLVHRNGTTLAIEDSAAPILDRQGEVIGVVLVFHDVSEAHKMAAQMTHQATHDALTGLINRREFERRVELSLQSRTIQDKPHTVLYLDLDQFKIVNDTSGHVAGDELLRQLTAELQSKLRRSDTLARLGGDEFGVLLEGCPTETASRIAELLRRTVSDFHFIWEEKKFVIGVSIGLVTFGSNGYTLADILRMADAACYAAKDNGRNRVHVYTPDDKELAQRHGEIGWIGRIKQALDEHRFVLCSQKIFPLRDTVHSGEHCELLLRMLDETGNLIPPMAFIPAAERYGLMPQLDRWVIKSAFDWYANRNALNQSGDTITINLSGTSISDEHLLSFVQEQFALSKIPPHVICFEITETSAIANLSKAAVLIRDLKAIGCRFSLDDFGSGMSSFAYLKHLPVDYLKIDGGFVKDMIEDPIDRAMVEAINQIGHVMGIQTVAEFVENEAILQELRKIGVDFAQGYGIEKPQPLPKG